MVEYNKDQDQAVNDLRWIGNRIKGVLAILPELENMTTLSSKIAESERFLEEQKKQTAVNAEKLAAEQVRLSDLRAQGEVVRAEAQNKAKQIIAEAQQVADGLIQRASDEAEDTLVGMQQKLADIKDQIASKKDELDRVVAEVRTNQDTFNSIKSRIQALKDSF